MINKTEMINYILGDFQHVRCLTTRRMISSWKMFSNVDNDLQHDRQRKWSLQHEHLTCNIVEWNEGTSHRRLAFQRQKLSIALHK